jgi:predicted RNase H-like HicB family nuclease
MKYVYAAVFKDEDGYVQVSIPDLPGLYTFGDTLLDAMGMVKDAGEMWLWDAENKGESIPKARTRAEVEKEFEGSGGFVNLVILDTDEYRRLNDTRAVKKTLSIPGWLNYRAEQTNAPFSQILQEGLKNYISKQS